MTLPMDQLTQSMFGDRDGAGAWTPSADIIETDNAYLLEIELPGVRREDVDVSLNGNELVVTGAQARGPVPQAYAAGR